MMHARWLENLGVAIESLRTRKMRSMLTLLGVVIGVTSVISVAAIISGLNRFVQERVEKLGSRTYFVARIQLGPQNFGRLPEKIRKRRNFEYSYARELRERCPSLDIATIFGTRAAFFGQANEIRYGAEKMESVFIRGVEPEYADALPLFEVEFGRFVTSHANKDPHDHVTGQHSVRCERGRHGDLFILRKLLREGIDFGIAAGA